MKVILVGGTGHVGSALTRHFKARGDELIVLSRRPKSVEGATVLAWDGESIGPWADAFNGADVCINLAGRTVNCRYNAKNLNEMMTSRTLSTAVVGKAIAAAKNPPAVWLQASTATIYAHRFDAANDEYSGIIGGDEPGAPAKWVASINIAKAWEKTLNEAETPRTRKVALRSAMTMSIDAGGIFDTFCGLVRQGIGGKLGNGRQFVSWIHEEDFSRAVQFLIDSPALDGPVNLASPYPLPQAEFMAVLRKAMGVRIGLNFPAWMVEIGTLLKGTESELVMKSRRVIPTRLTEAGFTFNFPEWPSACADLLARLK